MSQNIDLSKVIFDSAMLYYGDFNLENADTLLEELEGKELGLSDGGITFTSTPEIRQIPVAGALERKLKGYERIIKVDGKVEGEIVVINNDTLEMSLMEKAETTSTKYDKYVPCTGVIKDDKYKSLLVVGTTGSGEAIIIHLKNTYNSVMEVSTTDKEEGKAKISFESAYDPKKNKEVPVEIYIPKVQE